LFDLGSLRLPWQPLILPGGLLHGSPVAPTSSKTLRMFFLVPPLPSFEPLPAPSDLVRFCRLSRLVFPVRLSTSPKIYSILTRFSPLPFNDHSLSHFSSMLSSPGPLPPVRALRGRSFLLSPRSVFHFVLPFLAEVRLFHSQARSRTCLSHHRSLHFYSDL